MQAFVRKDKRDQHQASVHERSSKFRCQCPQCEASVERYWIWNSLLISNTGIIYLSTSCVSTRDVSSAQEPLSPSAHIAARCGRASASQALTPVSTLRVVSGSSSALTGILSACNEMIFDALLHICLKTDIFAASPSLTGMRGALTPLGLKSPSKSRSPCSILKQSMFWWMLFFFSVSGGLLTECQNPVFDGLSWILYMILSGLWWPITHIQM